MFSFYIEMSSRVTNDQELSKTESFLSPRILYKSDRFNPELVQSLCGKEGKEGETAFI